MAQPAYLTDGEEPAFGGEAMNQACF